MHDIDSVPQHKRSISKPPVGFTHRAGLLSYRQYRRSQGNNKSLFYHILFAYTMINFYNFFLFTLFKQCKLNTILHLGK